MNGNRSKVALDTMNQGLCLFDANGHSVVINRRFEEIFGLKDGVSRVGIDLAAMLDGSAALTVGSEMERRLLASEEINLIEGRQIEQKWPDGRSITLMRTPAGDGGYLLTVVDVTEARQASERIVYLARHDPLTDLPNRLLLRERMQEIRRYGRSGDRCAVMCLDLDRFKAVNDTLGHLVGDALLVAVAKRLKALTRPTDIIARLGGDEFAIVQLHVDRTRSSQRLAERIVATLAKPFSINGHRIQIGVSLGIAIEETGLLDPLDALRKADLALYASKSEGRSRWNVFTTEMHDTATARHRLENDLRSALAQNEFRLHFQPQLDLETRRVTAVEALIRWQHVDRGEVSPSEFIGICEEIGLIDDIGAYVINQAVMEARTWSDDIRIAVNLSPVQFRSGRLVKIIDSALAQSGLAPNRLELEVTETLMLEDFDSVLGQLIKIKKLGCSLSLDDFGTGYSSLSYIRQFPFDKIKIDQSFVRELGGDMDSLAIIRAVTGLCGSLAIKSTAEGVETQEQLEILKQEHCDSAQGYLISPPIPSSQIRTFLRSVNGSQDDAKKARAA